MNTGKKIMKRLSGKGWVAATALTLALLGADVASSPVEASAAERDTERVSIELKASTSWVANSVDTIKAATAAVKQNETYTIQWGDTLWGISQATGDTIEDLVATNGIKDPDLIIAGEQLIINLNGKQVAALDKVSDAKEAKSSPSQATQEDVVEADEDVAVDEVVVETEKPVQQVETPAETVTKPIVDKGLLDDNGDIKEDKTDIVAPKEDVVVDEAPSVGEKPAEETPVKPEAPVTEDKEQPKEEETNDESVVPDDEDDTIEDIIEDETNDESVVPDDEDGTIGEVVEEDDTSVPVEETPAPETPSEDVVAPVIPSEPIIEDEKDVEDVEEESNETITYKEVRAKENFVEFVTETIENPDLPVGSKNVLNQGSIGYDIVVRTFDENGVEVKDAVVLETIAPVNAVVEVGTKPITTVKRVNQTTTLKPGVSYVENKDLEKGVERVKTEGVAGKSVQAFDVTLDANGVEISRVAVGAPLVTPAVNKVVEVGTKTIVTKKIVKRTTEDTKAIEVVQELTDTMRLGEEKVKSNGSKAVIETSYELVYEDGVLVSETVVAGSQKVIKAATPKVILVGTMRYLNAYENPEQELKIGDTFNDPRYGDSVIERFIINETRTFDELKALSASERYSNANNNDLQNIVQTKVENGTHWTYWNYGVKLGTMTVNNFNSESMIDMGLYNQHFLKLVNEKRTAAGLSALSTSATLKAGSDLRAQEQADYGDISSNGVGHQRPNGTRYDTAFSDDVRSQFAIGENIGAFSYNGNPNRVVSEQYLAEYAFNQLWGSEPHRNNMMNQYYTHQYVSIRMNKTYKNNNAFTYFTYTQILGIQK